MYEKKKIFLNSFERLRGEKGPFLLSKLQIPYGPDYRWTSSQDLS